MKTTASGNAQSTPRQAYIAVAISFFITGAAGSTWLARIPFIQEHLKIGNALLGIAFLCLSIGSIAGMKIAGYLAAKLGSKQLIVWSTALMCLIMPVPGLVSDFLMLCLSILLFGIFLGTINILMNTLAVELEKQLEKPIMSSMHGLHSIGTMIGAIIGSLVSMVRMEPWIHFSLAALIFATSLPISQKWLNIIEEKTEIELASENNQQRKVAWTPYLMTLGAVAFCSCWCEGLVADWSGVYFRSVLNTSIELASHGFVGFCITMSLGRMFGDWALKRIGSGLMVRGGIAIALIGIIVSLLSTNLWIAAVGFSLVGLGLANIVPIVFRAAGNALDANPSESLATVASISYFSFLIGPPVEGFVAQYCGLRVALAIAIPLLALIALFAQSMNTAIAAK